MLTVGLTGGLASGKSTAAEAFAALGAGIVDADTVARELVEPGEPALAEIIAAFGDEILKPDGHLDRSRLRARITADAEQRRRLEAILHPRIRELLVQRARDQDTPYTLMIIPLLIETGFDDLVDRVLVVDTAEALQVERALARGLPRHEVDAIMAAQASRQARLAAADDVITNDGSLDQLRQQVRLYHDRYTGTAQQP